MAYGYRDRRKFIHTPFAICHKPGFTLVEILVALAILVVIAASTYTVFRGVAQSWLRGDIRTQRFQNARIILEQMSREISQAIVGLEIGGRQLYCLGTQESFFFICPIEAGSPQTSDLAEVGYYLKDTTLMRHFQASPDYDFSPLDTQEEFSENVSSIRFSYFDGTTWRDSWDSRLKIPQMYAKPPKAVKIELVLIDRRGKESESFQVVVFLPASR
jgi:prepilin-type N-terminal cleavage/methylation domain-containing protein